MSEDVRNEGFDDWLDAVAAGDPYYLRCPNGHGSLPPRRVCPHCGSPDLVEESLPKRGEVETYTETYVAAPSFTDDAPYTVAIADFGPVQITGHLRDLGTVEVGSVVGIDVSRRETTDDRILIFTEQ